MTTSSSRLESRRRGIPFALAVAGAGALTIGAIVGSATLGLLIASMVLAGSSARCATSTHHAAMRRVVFARAASVGFTNRGSRSRSGEIFEYALVDPGGATLSGSGDGQVWSDGRREIGASVAGRAVRAR